MGSLPCGPVPQFCWVPWGLLFDIENMVAHLRRHGSGLKIVDIAEVTQSAPAVAGIERHLRPKQLRTAVRRNATRDRCTATDHIYCQQFVGAAAAMNSKCLGSRKNLCIDCIVRVSASVQWVRQKGFAAQLKRDPNPAVFLSGFTAFTLGSSPLVADVDWAKGVYVPRFEPSLVRRAHELVTGLIGPDASAAGSLCTFQLRLGALGVRWDLNVTRRQMQACKARHGCRAAFLATDSHTPEVVALMEALEVPYRMGGYTNSTARATRFEVDSVALAVENEVMASAKAFMGTLGSSPTKMVYVKRLARGLGNSGLFCSPGSLYSDQLCAANPDHAAIIRAYHSF